MKAYVVNKWCTPREMEVKELPDPVPGEGEVLVDIHAIGLNFPDILFIAGKYQVRPPRPFIPGVEVAGVVSAVGPGVSNKKVGDRVAVLCWLGGYSNKVKAPVTDVYNIPDSMSYEEAAGITVTYQSSYFGVVRRAELKEGETMLVHAGAGGIGTSAIQIGKAIGAKVIATVGSEEKIAIAKSCGADEVINYRENQHWDKTVRKEMGGADVVIDPVGGDTLLKSLKCMKFEGRLVVVGFTSGTITQIPANLVLLNNISIVGLHWNLYQKDHPDKIRKCVEDILAWYEKGKIKPIIQKTVPFSDIPSALEEIGERKTHGKIIAKPE
ncbi:MAG: NADPH:quinone oxidoreductase family protein [Leptospiraceae bacterium]|nr:NADPH:quinone oxidoreductase family protein [Leptospiraceae bacterium]MCP5500877.1 NADPH:quinone oxidoreductase family protein [Leptospiraceae bacterium]